MRSPELAPNSLLNEAIIAYLGWKSKSHPQTDYDAVARLVGPCQAEPLFQAARAMTSEIVSLPIDWSQHTLISGTDWAVAEMRARHPHLSQTALDALGWKFSFDWK